MSCPKGAFRQELERLAATLNERNDEKFRAWSAGVIELVASSHEQHERRLAVSERRRARRFAAFQRRLEELRARRYR